MFCCTFGCFKFFCICIHFTCYKNRYPISLFICFTFLTVLTQSLSRWAHRTTIRSSHWRTITPEEGPSTRLVRSTTCSYSARRHTLHSSSTLWTTCNVVCRIPISRMYGRVLQLLVFICIFHYKCITLCS